MKNYLIKILFSSFFMIQCDVIVTEHSLQNFGRGLIINQIEIPNYEGIKFLSAQTYRVSGELTDIQNQIIQNANLQVYQNNELVTIANTSLFGKFALNLDPGNYTVQITDSSGNSEGTIELNVNEEAEILSNSSSFLFQNFLTHNSNAKFDSFKINQIDSVKSVYSGKTDPYGELIFNIEDSNNTLSHFKFVLYEDNSAKYKNKFDFSDPKVSKLEKTENPNVYKVTFQIRPYKNLWGKNDVVLSELQFTDNLSNKNIYKTNSDSNIFINGESLTKLQVPKFRVIDTNIDHSTPFLKSIQFDKKAYHVSDKVKVTMTAEDPESYVEFLSLSTMQKTNGSGSHSMDWIGCSISNQRFCNGINMDEDLFIELVESDTPGKYTMEFNMPKYIANGEYNFYIQMGNFSSVGVYRTDSKYSTHFYKGDAYRNGKSENEYTNIEILKLQIVENDLADMDPPKLEYIKYDHTSYPYDSIARVTFKITDEFSGFNGKVKLKFYGNYSSESFMATPTGNENEYFIEYETGSLTNNLTLMSITISDQAENGQSYSCANSTDTYYQTYDTATKKMVNTELLVPKATIVKE